SVPRNVNPDVASNLGVKLFTIDDLKTVVDENRQKQLAIIDKAEPILMSALVQFTDYLTRKKSATAIASLHNEIQNIRKRVLARARPTMSAPDYAKFDRLSSKLVNQILHAPTIELRANPKSARLVAELFSFNRENHHQTNCAH